MRLHLLALLFLGLSGLSRAGDPVPEVDPPPEEPVPHEPPSEPVPPEEPPTGNTPPDEPSNGRKHDDGDGSSGNSPSSYGSGSTSNGMHGGDCPSGIAFDFNCAPTASISHVSPMSTGMPSTPSPAAAAGLEVPWLYWSAGAAAAGLLVVV